MRPDNATTRERILKTTVGMLGKRDLQKLTVRQIAAEAGVNVAAINYHFQSKDHLVDEAVFTFSAKALIEGMKILGATDVPPVERLTRFFQGYAYGIVEFGAAARAAFQAFIGSSRAGGKYKGMMGEMLVAVRSCIREMTDISDEAELGRRSVMLFSAVIFPCLSADAFRETGGVDFANRAERDRYIESLVEAVKAGRE